VSATRYRHTRETRQHGRFFNRSYSNRIRSSQDPIGLNIGLYSEMDAYVRRTFRSEITISEDAVVRATYFHGYLLEQTLQLFDINPLECSTLEAFMTNNLDTRQSILRSILLTPKVLILKEHFYSHEGMIHR
jgi:hypothetical protein